jgi:hypothetical protein
VIQRPIGIGLIQLVLLDRFGFGMDVLGEGLFSLLAIVLDMGFKVHVCTVSVGKASGLSM